MKQHPIHALLTPDPGEQAPAPVLRRSRVALSASLPAPLPFEGLGLSVLLTAPTARVRAWLVAESHAVAVESAGQRAARAALGASGEQAAALAPALLFTRNKQLVAKMPLVVNARTLLPRTGQTPGAAVELSILAYSVTAEAMRGPAAGASFVELAWRRIDLGTSAFMAPVARPSLRQRLAATLGVGTSQQRRAIAAAFFTETRDTAGLGEPGGINWRLTHD